MKTTKTTQADRTLMWQRGSGDARLRGWELSNGTREIETNGDSISSEDQRLDVDFSACWKQRTLSPVPVDGPKVDEKVAPVTLDRDTLLAKLHKMSAKRLHAWFRSATPEEIAAVTVPCDGEAHRNLHIDHCMTCLGTTWGRVLADSPERAAWIGGFCARILGDPVPQPEHQHRRAGWEAADSATKTSVAESLPPRCQDAASYCPIQK